MSDFNDANRDPLTNEPGSHPVGTGVGAALGGAAHAPEPVLRAESLRAAAHAFGRIAGRIGVDDVLDRIFSRFCIGK